MRETVVSRAPQGMPPSEVDPRLAFLLRHADDNLVLAQGLGELISRAPDLEEDIAIANIALDHLGVARGLYTYAGDVEGLGRGEDDFAMQRTEREYTNLLLLEQTNGDFAHTIVRSFLFDTYQVLLWDGLSRSDDQVVSGIAAKALKEARYHLRHSSTWVRRLGGGTEESHSRLQSAVDDLWRFTGEMFEVEEAAHLRETWMEQVTQVLGEANVTVPADGFQRSGGRTGFHTEHLGFLIAEMQWMERAYPGLAW